MNATRLTMWVVAAAAAVGITTAAVTVANADSDDNDVLTQSDVSRELAVETATPTPSGSGSDSTASPSPSVATPPEGDAVTFERVPGRVVAGCDTSQAGDGQPWLVSWSPNPGYRVDDVARGPADQVAVEFESDTDSDIVVIITCENGEAVVTDVVEPDDHGGDRDDDNDDVDDYDDDPDDDDDDDRSGSNSGSG